MTAIFTGSLLLGKKLDFNKMETLCYSLSQLLFLGNSPQCKNLWRPAYFSLIYKENAQQSDYFY